MSVMCVVCVRYMCGGEGRLLERGEEGVDPIPPHLVGKNHGEVICVGVQVFQVGEVREGGRDCAGEVAIAEIELGEGHLTTNRRRKRAFKEVIVQP